MAYTRTGYANFAAFPVTGAVNIIYVDLSNGNEYTWVTSAYVAYTGTLAGIRTAYQTSAWFSANGSVLLGKGQRVDLEQTGLFKLGDGVTLLSALEFKSSATHKDTAWFTANAAVVIEDKRLIYCSDGANQGKYCIGDGTTALSSLVFYGGISASGLTVGTTTITGGTSGRVMYNNAGVVGEYAVTGTGTTAVLSTSPTFVTDITTPLIYGGTGSGGNMTLQSTTNATKGKILFGTSGYDEVNNRLGIGTSSPSQLIHVSTTTMGQGGLFGNAYIGVSATTTNAYAEFRNNGSSTYALAHHATLDTYLNANAGRSVYIAVGTNTIMQIMDRRLLLAPAAITSGAQNTFTITVPANSGQTAGANISNFTITGNTKTWATGAVALEYFNYVSASTVAAAAASTFTHVSNFRVDAPLQGTNATATNLYAIDCGGHMFIANSVGVPSNNPTGGGIIYVEAGALKYRGSSGTVTILGAA